MNEAGVCRRPRKELPPPFVSDEFKSRIQFSSTGEQQVWGALTPDVRLRILLAQEEVQARDDLIRACTCGTAGGQNLVGLPSSWSGNATIIQTAPKQFGRLRGGMAPPTAVVNELEEAVVPDEGSQNQARAVMQAPMPFIYWRGDPVPVDRFIRIMDELVTTKTDGRVIPRSQWYAEGGSVVLSALAWARQQVAEVQAEREQLAREQAERERAIAAENAVWALKRKRVEVNVNANLEELRQHDHRRRVTGFWLTECLPHDSSKPLAKGMVGELTTKLEVVREKRLMCRLPRLLRGNPQLKRALQRRQRSER